MLERTPRNHRQYRDGESDKGSDDEPNDNTRQEGDHVNAPPLTRVATLFALLHRSAEFKRVACDGRGARVLRCFFHSSNPNAVPKAKLGRNTTSTISIPPATFQGTKLRVSATTRDGAGSVRHATIPERLGREPLRNPIEVRHSASKQDKKADRDHRSCQNYHGPKLALRELGQACLEMR
jgi:hypothetical protein